ncbi:hypothetical protein [Streptomyces sp. NBC_01187]|uniref:hypothetical protein n=1 Tax=Streptomyces sp. NBC_01187 TaxID=2903766 RepID=UPI003864913E|nr:hypothetical protein OG220_01705 [Streptomyces sp. NBC_01187]
MLGPPPEWDRDDRGNGKAGRFQERAGECRRAQHPGRDEREYPKAIHVPYVLTALADHSHPKLGLKLTRT